MARYGPEAIERLRELLSGRPEPPPPSGPWAEGRRAAAVLAPLFVDDAEVRVVLTKKGDRLRSHRGQVSFPGGAWEPGDVSLLETALRESSEEIGLRPEDVDVLGPIEDLPTATTGYVIRPYVGVVPHPYAFRPDGFEVERVFSAPLALFADPGRRRTERWEHGGFSYPVYFFDDVDGELVWGATARMLVGLVELIERS